MSTTDQDQEGPMSHGPILGPFNAALGSAAVGTLGYSFGVSPFFPVALTVLGAAALWAVGVMRGNTGAVLVFPVACWIAAGAWVTWVVATTPWTLKAWCVLIVATVLSGLLSLVCISRYRKHDSDGRRLFVASRRNRVAADWEDRLSRVCGIQRPDIVGVQDWDHGTGYTLDVELPAGGTTWKQIATRADGLAADARLPEGCGVEVGPGFHRGTALIRVSTVNALIEEQPFPTDYSETTINNPFPIGIHRDAPRRKRACDTYVGYWSDRPVREKPISCKSLTPNLCAVLTPSSGTSTSPAAVSPFPGSPPGLRVTPAVPQWIGSLPRATKHRP